VESELGHFLVDIRTRMMGLDIHLLPLRQSKQDILPLAALALSKKNIHLDDEEFDQLVKKLHEFHWKGNIRQLFKSIDAWILTCEFQDLPLTVENFPVFKGMLEGPPESSASPAQPIFEFDQLVQRDSDFDEAISWVEKTILSHALRRHPSVADCCKALNISRSAMDARRRKYGL
ncbi:MAG TPA: hypothetical protein VE954_15830, partial [Oligoflexus sp.]|nr:hypothetical protein [Oligoflexus sp.]